jgi:signal transduction histidine kinase
LTVQDDGCGFDVVQQRQGWDAKSGFGLFSIAQQLRPIGGMLKILSTPESGTRAIVIVPLTAEAATT